MEQVWVKEDAGRIRPGKRASMQEGGTNIQSFRLPSFS
jgi:hypothetical protein